MVKDKGAGCLAGERQRPAAGCAQVLVERRRGTVAHDVLHDLARECGDWSSAGQRFEHDQPKGVGQAREDRDVAGRVGADKIVPGHWAEEFHTGVFLRHRLARRPGADHDLGAGEVEGEERLDVLLHRDAADIEEDGTRIGKGRVRHGPETVHVHAALPQPHVLESLRFQLPLHGRRAGHGGDGAGVEPALDPPDQALGDERKAGMDIFGEAGVEGRGEFDAVLEADGARAEAHRALGRDMHRVRREFADELLEALARKDREANLGIGGKRHAEAALRRRIAHLVAHRRQLLAEQLQRRHDTVDLRLPGIGDDKDLQVLLAGNGKPACGHQSARQGTPHSTRVQAPPGRWRRRRRVWLWERPNERSPDVRGHLRQGPCSFQPSLHH